MTAEGLHQTLGGHGIGKHDPGKISSFGRGHLWQWEPGDATRYSLIVIPTGAIEPGGHLGGLGDPGWLVTYGSNGQTWLFPSMPISTFDVAENLKIANRISIYQVTRSLGLITGLGAGADLDTLARELAEARYWRGLGPEHQALLPSEAQEKAIDKA